MHLAENVALVVVVGGKPAGCIAIVRAVLLTNANTDGAPDNQTESGQTVNVLDR